MMNGGRQSEPPPGGEAVYRESAVPASRRAPGRDQQNLLSRMVNDYVDGDADFLLGRREALRPVARRHSKLELCVKPVTVELVMAALIDYFKTPQRMAQVWLPVAQNIAETLHEHAVSRRRLASLWNELRADVGGGA